MSGRRTSILVRRFEDLSPEADMAYFAHGFQEDLITELTRFATLEVFAPSDRETNCEHELAGSIRRTPGHLGVHARLVESANGRTLWARRFELDDSDLFALQGQIAGEVAGTLAVRLDGLRLERARASPPTRLAAYDLWLRGRAELEQGTPESDLAARDLFERALALDPRFSRAYAGISLSYYNDWSCQSWHLWKESEEQAKVWAERAVEIEDGDAFVHIVLARVQIYRREHERAERSIERALALNPNDAEVNVHAALWSAYLGRTERALRLGRRAMDLNPRHGDWYHVPALWAHFLDGNDAEALREGERAGLVFVDTPALRAAAAALSGRAVEAQRLVAEYRRLWLEKVSFGRAPAPSEEFDWMIQVNPLRQPEHRERLEAGLRAAGIAPGPVSNTPEIRPADLPGSGNRFRREGDAWQLDYAGRGARLAGVKGFSDLARLLAEPGRAIHCLELAGAPREGGAAAVFDTQARREIERRLQDLRQEQEEAEAAGDLGRLERARAELDDLGARLAGALGLGGRSRKLGDAAERARSAVTWRIRSAIQRVAAAHPQLGQHLENSIRTGVLCSYRPERPTVWDL
jgi:TolB-like protein